MKIVAIYKIEDESKFEESYKKKTGSTTHDFDKVVKYYTNKKKD